ncbi:MAG TPA: DinB family protein [Thermoanaerobaculaceae bacterium]|nr:DinB family protein [Thermoanaerobaculaceae bacterium]
MTEPGEAQVALEPALVELRQRLDEDLAALLAAVADVSQEQADWKPAPERWSVGELLHHLGLANRQFARAVAMLIGRGRSEGLAAPPGSRRAWPRMRSIADASRSGPIKHPARVTPTRGLPVDELRRELAASHAAVAEQIPGLAALDLDALRFPHPLGFELNLYQWVDITGAHERRHLAQINAVIASPGFPAPASRRPDA